MKQILVMMAAVVLVGCGKKEPELRSNEFITPNEAANKLYVDAVQLITSAEGKTGEAAIADYEEGLAKISKILSDHRESDLAVKLISGETLFTGKSLNEIKGKVADLKSELTPQESTVSKLLAGKLSEQELQKIEELELHNTKITDEGLKEVAKLQKLWLLILRDTKITDTGLKEVAKLQELDTLSLDGTKITDEGLKEVAKLQKLRELYLSDTKITDVGLKELVKLPNLRRLNLSGTKITDAGVAELKKALPKCNIIGLDSR